MRQAKTAQFSALGAKVMLRCAEGRTNQQTTADLGIDKSTVTVGARFIKRLTDRFRVTSAVGLGSWVSCWQDLLGVR